MKKEERERGPRGSEPGEGPVTRDISHTNTFIVGSAGNAAGAQGDTEEC